MNRILLVDLGERELKKREELRARQQVLETIDKTAATSGGLSSRQKEELDKLKKLLASDVVVDPFYQLVAATHQQKDWAELAKASEFVHEYGLVGSQRTLVAALSSLKPNECEIAAICGLLQNDGYTDDTRSDFVQRISVAQGEYRKNRKLFDASFIQLGTRYKVSLKSQIDSGLIDRHIIGCVDASSTPQSRSDAVDPAVLTQAAEKAVKEATAKSEAADIAKAAAGNDATAKRTAVGAAQTRVADAEDALSRARTDAEKAKAQADLKTAKAALAAASKAADAADDAVLAADARAQVAAQALATAKQAATPDAIKQTIDANKAKFVPSEEEVVCALSARNIAAVVRRLAVDGISANDAWLASRIQNVYDMQTGVVSGAPPSAMEIMLPDLDESTDVEMIRENLHAVQAIYFAYMLEEMRLPQVVERIVELFRQGLLPLGRGKAGDYLFRYYKMASERITEGERRDLYMRCFGAPGGDPNGNQPNREFNELWLRFVSAVSSFGRQLSVDRLLRANVPVSVSQEQVRKAARDLGASLSRCGFGIAYFAATELQTMILEYRDLLSDSEVRGAFGARDMWQVIDQVNSNYLGGARNTHRYRTQARAGAVIIRWIANNHQRLTNRFGEVIALSALTNPQLRGSDQPTVEPNDWDLVQACEQWLAVGGVQEESIEHYSQSVESPVITSKPMEQMRQFAQDVIEQSGISLPGM